MATRRISLGGDVGITASGLDDLVRDLRRAERTLPKVVQQANKKMAERVSAVARKNIGTIAGAASSQMRTAAKQSVRPRARQKSASVALLGSKGGFGQTFEFGTRWHFIPTGKGRGRYYPAAQMRRRVFPPWVGNQFHGGDWKDGLHGKSGHVVAPAISEFVDRYVFADEYADALDKAIREFAS